MRDKKEYLKHLEILSRKKKHPLSMQIELTPLCTLDCKMCYIRLSHDEVASLGGTIPTKKWIKVIDEAIDAGVLNITLSGGEAMLHPGFFEIYKRAYDKGALVSVISNATLIDNDAINFFVDHPPENISVTLYGASSDTYQKLCGNGDAYNKAFTGLENLVKHRIRVSLQTTLTKDNVNDIQKIRQIAEEKGIPYSFNNYLASYGQCSAKCVQDNEVNEQERLQVLTKVYPNYKKEQLDLIKEAENSLAKPWDKNQHFFLGMRCGAGNNAFQVNWKGEIGLCTMLDLYRADILENSLIDKWDELVKFAESIPQIPECTKCTHSNCTRCIAMHYADTKRLAIRSKRLCPILNKEIYEEH